MGWNADTGSCGHRPEGHAEGRYEIGVRATNQGRTATPSVPVDVVTDVPTARAPVVSLASGGTMGMTDSRVTVSWPAATDPSSAIAGYELQTSVDGGAWARTLARSAAAALGHDLDSLRHALPVPGPDAGRGRQLEPVGPGRDHQAASGRRPQRVDRPPRRLDPAQRLVRVGRDRDRLGPERAPRSR